MRHLPDAVFLIVVVAFLAAVTVLALAMFRVVGFYWWGAGAAVATLATGLLIAHATGGGAED